MRLTVRDLRVATVARPDVPLIEGVSFDLPAAGRLAVSGPSGAGKSMLVRAVAGFLPEDRFVVTGSVRTEDDGATTPSLLSSSRAAHRSALIHTLTVIWQDSLGGLNPCRSVGRQLVDTIRLPGRADRPGRAEAARRALEWIHRVGIDSPRTVYAQYPHMLSGGMRQRVSLALGLCGGQPVVFADEPTTSLDMIRQQECVALLDEVCAQDGRSLVFVSHDLALLARVCENVMVLADGRVVDRGPILATLADPADEVTRDLVRHTRRLRDPLGPPPGAAAP